jgi:hypothetical protein
MPYVHDFLDLSSCSLANQRRTHHPVFKLLAGEKSFRPASSGPIFYQPQPRPKAGYP